MSPEQIRAQFPQLAGMHYLDTAASAQKPAAVLDAMQRFARDSYANVHRGIYHRAEVATEAFENARATIARLINAPAAREVIFTSGTTAGINLLARAIEHELASGEIVVTIMEHHSNFVPWQQLAHRNNLTFKVVGLTPEFALDLEQLRTTLSPQTKIVALAHVSNVLGTVNSIPEIVRIVRERAPNALVIVDGAQAIAHLRVDVQQLGCDAYAFSAHKMYGPTGIGALWVRHNVLERMHPVTFGGEMVKNVTVAHTTWNDVPWRFEAGTPPIIEAVGFASAAHFLTTLGYDAIRKHENELINYLLERLPRIPGVSLLGPHAQPRGGAFSFTAQGVHPHDVAHVLDMKSIAVRAGDHCAQPLHCALGLDASARASLGIYTTRENIDAFLAALHGVQEAMR